MKFYDYLNEHTNELVDLYTDMDGVIAEYDIGNFDYDTIRPLKSVIKQIEAIAKNKNINVYILSVCKTNQIVEDKKIWLRKYMPFFNLDNAILLSKEDNTLTSKELKSNYLKENIKNTSVMIDDDPAVTKFLLKNNKKVKVFDVSSLID